ncbi:MAG TPA: endonuclease domain-containing protein [Caulobacteraceae bacterium]
MRSPTRTHDRAKSLRQSMSPPEVFLWQRLRERHPSRPVIRRQHPIGPYVADFYCSTARLVIEIDGSGHADQAQREHNRRRDAYMERLGYRVIRCLAADVMKDADAVAQDIFDSALAPPPSRR